MHSEWVHSEERRRKEEEGGMERDGTFEFEHQHKDCGKPGRQISTARSGRFFFQNTTIAPVLWSVDTIQCSQGGSYEQS